MICGIHIVTLFHMYSPSAKAKVVNIIIPLPFQANYPLMNLEANLTSNMSAKYQQIHNKVQSALITDINIKH